MDELTYYMYQRGDDLTYGYGPDIVATMMWMEDYPVFYTKEEAKEYWEKTLKKELKWDESEDDHN